MLNKLSVQPIVRQALHTAQPAQVHSFVRRNLTNATSHCRSQALRSSEEAGAPKFLRNVHSYISCLVGLLLLALTPEAKFDVQRIARRAQHTRQQVQVKPLPPLVLLICI